MKVSSPLLLPLLRSRTQGEILAHILLAPDREQSISEIAESVDTSAPTVTREVSRLEDAGLVHTTKRGNTRLVRVLTDSVVYRPLVELLAVTFGPLAVLRDELTGVAGITQAFIYGSWAARYEEQPGPVPADIDLLVVGDPDRDELADAVEESERRLHREVNVRRVRADDWAKDTSSFKRTVLDGATVDVIVPSGGDDA
ncbi:MarR family transcriptional regulator [Cellulosimicrobium sp. Marseille-Q4280]|uniref:MarR family transcriptional regulator n=1 Tax=Cellulosimicrobium sp. Marseille-Q4280 TaxID=2937992 RepID=UPI002041FBEE|nr:MarR family transcriptional regulator [Cellulosimicrobium sp. Marseille-Q4280]